MSEYKPRFCVGCGMRVYNTVAKGSKDIFCHTCACGPFVPCWRSVMKRPPLFYIGFCRKIRKRWLE